MPPRSIAGWKPPRPRFNAGQTKIEGRKIKVRLVSMDGVEAMGKIGKGELTPNVWIPESTALLYSTNDDLRAKTGRDVFLTSGEYQRRVLVSTFLVLTMWDDRAQVFLKQYPQVDWGYDLFARHGATRLGGRGR